MIAVTETDTTVVLALVGVVAAAVTTLGIVIRALLQPLTRTANRIERHVNGIEEDIDHAHGPTLGQRVARIESTIDVGFARNDADHDVMKARMTRLEHPK